MPSIESILTIINSLVRRIGGIKLCQDHFKLIRAGLTRLQHALRQKDLDTNNDCLCEDVGQTLLAIDKIVISCQ